MYIQSVWVVMGLVFVALWWGLRRDVDITGGGGGRPPSGERPGDGLVAFLRRKVQGVVTMYHRSIRVTMGLVFVALALLGALSVGTSLWATQAQQHDALVMNLAGRQRMLSQKTAKEAWLGLQKGQDPRYLAEMHTTATQFEEDLRALMDGGRLTYAGTTVSVPPATDPRFRAALGEVAATWEPLHTAAHAVLESEPGSPAFIQDVEDLERLSDAILEQMDAAVRVYQVAAEARVARLRWIQLAFLLAGAIVLALGYGLILAQVLRPVSALEMAVGRMERGDLDYPIGVRVRNELGRLAGAFGDMRGRVKAQMREQVARNRILSATLRTIDLDERLNLILEEVQAYLQVEFGAIHLVQGREVVLRCWRGLSDAFRAHVLSFPADDPPAYFLKARIVHERLSEEGITPDFVRRDGIQAWACLPLRLPSAPLTPQSWGERGAGERGEGEEGEWLGAILVGSRRYEALGEQEIQALAAMADQLALAVDHARAYRQALERLARLQTLRDIDRAIIQRLDMQGVLHVVLERVPVELGADAAAISLLDEGQWRTKVFVMRLPNGTLVEEEAFTLADSLIHWLVERQEVVIIYDLSQDPRVQMHRQRIRDGRLVSYLGVPLIVRDRTIGILHILTTRPRVFADEDVAFFHTMAGQAAIAIQNAREYEEAIRRAEELRRAKERYQSLFEGVPVGLYRTTPAGEILDANPALVEMLGYPDREALLAANAADLYVDPEDRTRWRALMEREGIVRDFESRGRRRDGTVIWARNSARAVRDDEGRVLYYEGTVEDITKRKRAEMALRERAGLMDRLATLSETLNRPFATDEVLEAIGQGAMALSGADRAALYLRHPDDTVSCPWSHGLSPAYLEQVTARVREMPGGRLLEVAEPLLIPDVTHLPEESPVRGLAEAEGHRTIGLWPLVYEGRTVAAVGCYYDAPHTWSEAGQEVMEAFARQAAVALENARLFESLQARLHELSALAEVSTALRGAATVGEIAHILAAEAARLVRADAALLCLVDEARQRVIILGIAGLPSEAVGRQQGLEEGITAQVIRTGMVYRSPDLARDPLPTHPDLMAGLGPGVCVPLRTTAGEVVGTLLVGRRQPPEGKVAPFGPEEEGLLTTLAEMAGNALQRAHAHEELEEAYVQTVLALAAAMDARDTYTAGHSQRLAEWAVAVAQELGCSEDEMTVTRWGALLHDIGKIGVPDAILLKPGELDDAEWEVIKRHPAIGAEIVAPVKRLADVAPVIRAHQEHYDGSGYPAGLAGEEIPLGARILAVVDAYGAITDERPYKPARSHAEAVAELRDCAGTQFDPHVVEAFLRVLGEEGS